MVNGNMLDANGKITLSKAVRASEVDEDGKAFMFNANVTNLTQGNELIASIEDSKGKVQKSVKINVKQGNNSEEDVKGSDGDGEDEIVTPGARDKD